MKRRKLYALAMTAVLSASLMAGCAGNKGNAGTDTTAVESTASGTGGSQTEPAAGGGQTEAGPGGSHMDSSGESGKEGAGAEADQVLSDILSQIKDTYGETYRPQTEMDAQMLKDQIGIGPDLYENYIAEMPMISTFVETFIGIKAVDGHAEEIAELLESYHDRLLNDTMQYPMNIAVIQAAQVVRYDDYVFFVMLGSVDDAELEKGEDDALESAEKNNQIALDLIDQYFE